MARKLRYKDPEGDMAKAELQKIEKYAAKLNDMIHPDDELEAWVQSKLSRVASDMGDIKHYLDYETKKMKKGGVADDLKFYHVGIKYEEDGNDRDKVRIVKVHANSIEEAETIAEEKYGPYYDDFEIVDIEEKEYKLASEVSGASILEARRIVGEESWKKMSRDERLQITEYLINKGWIDEEEDELMGMQPDMSLEEIAAMQYKKGGKTDVIEYEREGIEHEMLEHEFKKRNKGVVPKWFKEMPLRYKRIIVQSGKK